MRVYATEDLEFFDRQALEAVQLLRLKKVIGVALATPFYKERLNGVGIRPCPYPAVFRILSDRP